MNSNESYLEKRKQFIEEEITNQVESLKLQLDECKQRMIDQLSSSCQNACLNIKSLEENNISKVNHIKNSTEELKMKAFSYAADYDKHGNNKEKFYLNSSPQKKSINHIFGHMSNLDDLNQSMNGIIDEIKFYPSIEPLRLKLIGTLKSVDEINLEEQFKVLTSKREIDGIKSIYKSSKKVPISPHCVYIMNSNNLLFTDLHSKQLVQLNLETSDYVRSTNLDGKLKNPDGICMNHKNGFIYISDSDQGIVFKLDTNFNIIKQLGKVFKSNLNRLIMVL